MFHPFLLENLFQVALPFAELHRTVHSKNICAQGALLERIEEGYTLKINLPNLIGRRLEDIKLTVEDDLLMLEIPALACAQKEGLRAVFEEFPSRSYTERYRLPRDVDLMLIEARLNDEELCVKLPKKAPNRQTIEIKVG